MSLPPTDRRRQVRHITCVPAGAKSAEKERVALLRDASATGALLLSRSQFAVNTQLALSVRLDDTKQELELEARVVRVERLKDGFWSFGVAVEFIPPRSDLEPLFKKLSSRQAKLYGETY